MNTEMKIFPDLMTEEELIEYLRIPEVSTSTNFKRVISNLKASRGLPKVYISRSCLYSLKAIREWIDKQVHTS